MTMHSDQRPLADGESSDGFEGSFDEGAFVVDSSEEADRASWRAAQRRRTRRVVAALGGLMVAAVAVPVAVGLLHRSSPGVEYRYVIPHGTSEELAAGKSLDVLPEKIEMRTQDTLIIVNEDHATFSVGGLRVAAEQTMTYHFGKPGNYGGTCELHEGRSVDIVVV